MTNRKYSKSSSFYLSTKKDFFDNNSALLTKAESQNAAYLAQPRRAECKICGSALTGEPDFVNHGVPYVFCRDCSHLNGLHDDSEDFWTAMYQAEEGADYSVNYVDRNYPSRSADVYAPKVDFLLDNLRSASPSILDVGCGGGYFVHAALSKGARASGIDVNRTLVDFSNAQIGALLDERPLHHVGEDNLFEVVSRSEADVISAIGVIEHLRDPQGFFDAFRKSGARYLYYSVPMFSLSVMIENAFPKVFPRQLSGGHTHLFTEKSIARMNEIVSVDAVAEWRFGTDMLDLFRSLGNSLEDNGASAAMHEAAFDGFGAMVDKFQAVLDENHFCSEIHLLGRKH